MNVRELRRVLADLDDETVVYATDVEAAIAVGVDLVDLFPARPEAVQLPPRTPILLLRLGSRRVRMTDIAPPG